MISPFNNNKHVSIDEMMDKALLWTDDYMRLYVPQNTPNRTDVRNEIFIFNAWSAWHYCLQHNLFQVKDDTAVSTFVASLLVHSSLGDTLGLFYFYDLIQARYAMYSEDVQKLANLEHPDIKYFPIGLYCAIYRNQYELNPKEDIDENEIINEMQRFTSNFITHWNTIQHDMDVDWK